MRNLDITTETLNVEINGGLSSVERETTFLAGEKPL
jgi:hypothetical protein